MLIFERKELNSFLKDQKLPKFYNKYFFKYFFNEKMWKCWHLMAEKLKGWSHKLETLHVETLGAILKKTRKQKNVAAALHCEIYIWNIQIFPKFFITWFKAKLFLDKFFKGSGQLVPSIWFTFFPQPVWIATDSLEILQQH